MWANNIERLSLGMVVLSDSYSKWEAGGGAGNVWGSLLHPNIEHTWHAWRSFCLKWREWEE